MKTCGGSRGHSSSSPSSFFTNSELLKGWVKKGNKQQNKIKSTRNWHSGTNISGLSQLRKKHQNTLYYIIQYITIYKRNQQTNTTKRAIVI